MPGPIDVCFFLSDRRHPVIPSGQLWEKPLPQARRSDFRPVPIPQVTYGQYFSAVRHVLLQEPVQERMQAVAFQRQSDAVASLAVFLEKHGQFYHPARIEAVIGKQTLNFVLNVALTEAGRACLRQDVRHTQRLQTEYPYCFVPQIYHFNDIGSDGAGQTLSVALGEWLTGFAEFHLAQAAQDGRQTLVIWDPDRGRTELPETLFEAVYRQAAKILAAYLNLDTFEHIRHWHHAAGDFVVQRRKDRIRMRLVTVRDYAPLFGDLEITPDNVLELLTVYLIKTALRMGLDRCNGTGTPVWAGNIAVSAAVDGTLDGLYLQADHGILPEAFVNGFVSYIKAYPVGELEALCRDMVVRWPDATIGRDLILDRIGWVATSLHVAIQHLDGGL
jgi:hypothetical protein